MHDGNGTCVSSTPETQPVNLNYYVFLLNILNLHKYIIVYAHVSDKSVRLNANYLGALPLFLLTVVGEGPASIKKSR